MLTSVGTGIEQYYPYLPLAVAIFCAVILLTAFCIGLKKGARRVSWSGFVWMFAAGAFIVLDKVAFVEGNPLSAAFAGIASLLVSTQKQAVVVAEFLGAFALAAICCLVALILYGVCSLLFRPTIKRVKKNADIYTIDEEGIEYDEEYYDYDDYEEYESRTTIRRKGYGTPSFGGRILGGVICMVNAAMVLAVIVFVALFAIDATSLKETAIGAIYQVPLVHTLVDYAGTYALDVAFIGIIISYACKGQQKGLIETVRAVISSLGGLAGAIFSFYLPFSPLAQDGFIGEYVNRCIDAGNALFGSTLPDIAPIIGQILAGLILCIFIFILLKIIDKLLKKLSHAVYANGVLRVIDGSIACLIYFVVGVVEVTLIWAAWYVLSFYGIFQAELLFTADSSLSSGMFATLDALLFPLLSQVGTAIESFLGPIVGQFGGMMGG
jgi:hypothetical protein